MPSVLSMLVCTHLYRYVGRALGPLYRIARRNRRQWRLWICLHRRASGHAATATYGPSRQGAPRMRTQRLWTQTHFHPSLHATAPTPVSTNEVEMDFFNGLLRTLYNKQLLENVCFLKLQCLNEFCGLDVAEVHCHYVHN